MISRQAQVAGSLLLLPTLAALGFALLAAMPVAASPYVAPAVASVGVFLVFAVLLRRQIGENIFGELGFLYVGFIVAYTVLPAVAFVVTGFSDGGPIASLLPEPLELRAHLWRHLLFQSGVAIGYLILRGRRPSQAPVIAEDRGREDLTLLFVAVFIVVSVSVLSLTSAPVESYYDHYVRYDHLPWLQRKLVSVAIRLSLGLYCVLLVFLFRNYQKYRRIIPFVVAGIVAHEMVYSFGARIQALIVLLQAVGLYHFMVRPISLRKGVVALLALGTLFSAVEMLRAWEFDFTSARNVVAEEGLRPASEFVAVFFSGFHLYAERAQGALPAVEWPMFFHDFVSLFTFGDFTRWNPMNWYAFNYYPESEVPPFTLGPIANSAIWGGEADLLVRALVNGLFFAAIMRWFLRFKERWWGMSVYVYVFATCILTVKYSVFLHLSLIEKNLAPTLVLVSAVKVFRWSRQRDALPSETPSAV